MINIHKWLQNKILQDAGVFKELYQKNLILYLSRTKFRISQISRITNLRYFFTRYAYLEQNNLFINCVNINFDTLTDWSMRRGIFFKYKYSSVKLGV